MRTLVATETVVIGVLADPVYLPVWLALVVAVVGVCMWTDRDTPDG
jgi:hypothetical protein